MINLDHRQQVRRPGTDLSQSIQVIHRDTLGLDEIEAHQDAHRLEHVLSPQVEGRLAEFFEVSTPR